MSRFYQLSILCLLCVVISSEAQAQLNDAMPQSHRHRVVIKTNGYQGNYAVKPEDERSRAKFISGDTTIEVSPATPYSINNGATLGYPGQPVNSYIWFFVGDDGKITGIEPIDAAVIHDSVIEFQTSVIDINPDLFTGQYLLSAYQFDAHNVPIGYSRGRISFTAIKNLSYSIKPAGDCRCGALGLQRNFLYFYVDAGGNVLSLNPTSIKSDKNTLTFITKPFTLDSAQNLCKQYKLFYITGYNKEPVLMPLKTPEMVLHIVCGEATCLNAETPEGVKCQCFFPK